MDNSNASELHTEFWTIEQQQYLPEMKAALPADAQQTQHYLRDLRKYLISGKKTKESLTADVKPIPLFFYQQEDGPETRYPVFYDAKNNSLTSWYPPFEKLIMGHFDEEYAAIIQKELPGIFARVQKNTKEEELKEGLQELFVEIIKAFHALNFPEKELVDFEIKREAIQQELIQQIKIIFGFNGKTAFHFLNLPHKQRGHLKAAFLLKLRTIISGLNELLVLQGDTSQMSNAKMDFVDDLISFEKVRDISVSAVSSELPESRLNRLRYTLQTLSTALESYTQGNTTIFVSEALHKSFELEAIFDSANIKVVAQNTCLHANLQSQKETEEFVKTIGALRMGQLLIDQKYKEELHDDYFDAFDLAHLNKEDLKYLHPVIVIENSRQLILQSKDFLRSLSKNSFVKILGLNLLEDLFDRDHQAETEYLELASLAIFRRCSYVFQGGMEEASRLFNAFQKGLHFPGPVFWNILIPSGEGQQETSKYVALKAAIESRYFPRIDFESNDNHFAAHQINLQDNPAADTDFPTYEQKIKSPSGEASLSLNLTMAQFLAMDSQLVKTLEVIPPIYQSSHFLPLNEYLIQAKDSLSGKIPFIWLVDNQKELRKAAIPVVWIQACRSRLDYWKFLQSISGINNDQLQDSLQVKKSEWEKTKQTEMEALKSALTQKYQKERSGDLQEAVTRMLYGLLDPDKNIERVLTEISTAEIQPTVEAQTINPPASTPTPPTVDQEQETPKAAISEVAWVETEECTSCKDCINALPSVFKYNEDKQAYVHNPQGGTFAEIVKLAEKCPARCIHPGIPQNSKEAALEKWLKRAEKYN